MKKSVLFGILILLLTACGGKTTTDSQQSLDLLDANSLFIDSSAVYVFYFHGKQRCKTCVAVGDVAEKTVKEFFADNASVKFVEVKTDEKSNTSLIEKYEVAWNALIIAKGDNSIDITERAFASAVNNPEVLTELIVKQIEFYIRNF